MERPVEVTRAIYCVLASLALAPVKIIFNLNYLEALGIPMLGMFIIPLVINLPAVFLLYKIHTGRNWARIIFVAFVILGAVSSPHEILAELERSPIVGVISVSQLLLQLFAAWLLFVDPSKSWFKSPPALKRT